MRRVLCLLLILGGCGEPSLPPAEARKAANFFNEQKVAREVLANGLIELTERVMILEQRQGIKPKGKKE